MTTEGVPKKMKKEIAYEKVEALRKKYPDWPVKKLIQKAGVQATAYYKHRRDLMDTKPRIGRPPGTKTKARPITKLNKAARVEHQTVKLTQNESGKLIVLMGNPDQIREVLQ